MLSSTLCKAISLQGYHFQDNLLEERFGPNNGYATIKIPKIPDQLSFCYKVFIENDRYGNIVGYIDFRRDDNGANILQIRG